MRYVLALLLGLFWALATPLSAQRNGWDWVSANNFPEARRAFDRALADNPGDEQALIGLLFLAETAHDRALYVRCANQLMATGWQPHYAWLFEHLYDGTPENWLAQALPQALRAPKLLLLSDSLLLERQPQASRELAQTVVPDWQWSLAGPFPNVQGSGFDERNALEISPFDPVAQFSTEEGHAFGWYQRRLFAPGAAVSFGALQPPNGLATYYANTFLQNPLPRRVRLAVSRMAPMKIWLDDQLLAVLPHSVQQLAWDAEQLTFELPAGTHRLLVKTAGLPDRPMDSHISLEFNDLDIQDDAVPTLSEVRRGPDGGQAGSWAFPGFQLRLLDPQSGLPLRDIKSSFEGSYVPLAEPPAPHLQRHPFLGHFEQQAQAGEPWALYLLAKAYFKCGEQEAAEAFFAAQHRAAPNAALGRYLLAKCFDANGKGERAEALLSEMDTVLTPTFAEHYARFLKINKDQEEETYLGALEQLLRISPANWAIMSTYLSFLQEKGRKEQLRNWVSAFLRENTGENWRERLEPYRQDESYKPESYQPPTEKERLKTYKKAKKALQKRFSFEHWVQVMGYHKYKEQTEQALDTYDELLRLMPWNSTEAFSKARFLFEKERNAEAVALLQNLLEHEPYNLQVLELLGDIATEEKKPAEALRWYRRAEKASEGRGRYYGLSDKIEKLENRRKYTGYFRQHSLTELAKDRGWEAEYPDEEAVVSFFSVQNVYIPQERRIESQRKAVIHIRTEAGAKNWTEANIQQVGQVSSAKVLKKDGTITSPEMGYGTAVFKNLQAGDIILLEGSSEMGLSDEIPGAFWDMHVPSWQVPVVQANLELLAPADMPLYFAANRIGADPILQRDTGEFCHYGWQWQRLPKLETEDGAPDTYDSYAWLMMGNAPDWSKVVRWYEQQTYRRTEPNYEVLEQARSLIRPGMSETEIFETLHTFVVRDINYSFVPFLNSNYVPKKPGETISGKVGDCKDVATLMIALLREHGIPAWYTLVSTHSFSNREPRPTFFIFNHAIVAYELKDKQLRFADLTTDYYPTSVLPDGDSHAWGLVIRPGETALRRLPNHTLDSSITRAELLAQATLDAEGKLDIALELSRHGNAAGHWREQLLRANNSDRRKQLSAYFSGGVLRNLDLLAFDFPNIEAINEPLRASLRLQAYNQLDRVSDLYLMPLPLPLSTPTLRAMFAAKRYNDLDLIHFFELAPVSETVTLVLPEGFALAEMPEDQRIESAFGHYGLHFERQGATLRIHRTLHFERRFVPHTEFQAFKQFYLDVLDADDQLLALRRG